MKIFNKEREAGLEQVIRDNMSIAFTVDLKPVEATKLTIDIAEKASLAKARIQDKQFDLYYMTSILASIGWNKNDDIFTIEDTWAARNSAVDKKFNFMHDEKDIIGHITGSWVLNESGLIITEDDLENGIPSNFDIVVASVLYKVWDDDALQNRMNEILAGVEEGKWYVSMECLFKHFDYGIKDAQGNIKVVARNEDTSFLTKYLRVYGGDGVFNDEQIGRVLRNFTFSGKGLVDKPANSRSIIFNSHNETSVSNIAESSMADVTVNVEELQTKVAALESAAASELEEKNKLMADKTNLETSVAELTTQLSQANTEIKAKSDELTKACEETASLKTQLEATQAELEAIKTKVAEEAQAAKLGTRKTKLIGAGASEADVDTLLNKWGEVNDELFDDFVAVLAAKKSADDDKKKKEEEAKAAEEAAKAENSDEAKAKAAELEKAKANEEVNLADDGEENTIEKTIAAVAENLGKHVFNKNKK